MRSLLATNVLVYADAVDEPARQRRAIEVIKGHRARGAAALCTPVLQEYVNVALRKPGLPASLIRERLALYRRFEIVTTTPDLIAGAIDPHLSHSLSFYDALIVQAAPASGCRCVMPEDTQSGARYVGVQIVNPFVG